MASAIKCFDSGKQRGKLDHIVLRNSELEFGDVDGKMVVNNRHFCVRYWTNVEYVSVVNHAETLQHVHYCYKNLLAEFSPIAGYNGPLSQRRCTLSEGPFQRVQ